MEALKEKIISNGRVLPGNVLKVDSFINQQIDTSLMKSIGEEFAKRFQNEKIDKILTIESSGIAPALMTALAINVPVVFARKRKSITLSDDVFSAKLFSYTTQKYTDIMIDKKFLSSDENVLIIDDFLANGQAVEGLRKIINEANANLVGVGIVIEKSFQSGRKEIEQKNIKLESLARISNFENGEVHFID